MVWYVEPRPMDDSEDSEAIPAPTPWRAAAPTTPNTEARRVALEAWDDELTKADLKPKPTVDQAEARAKRRALLLRVGNLALFALAVIGAAAGVAVAWMHVVGDPMADAHAYFDAATRLNQGKPLYPAGLDPNQNHIYLYPPLLAMA